MVPGEVARFEIAVKGFRGARLEGYWLERLSRCVRGDQFICRGHPYMFNFNFVQVSS